MPSKSINIPKWLGIWGLFFLVLAGFNNWLCFSTITYETASYFNTTAQALNQVSIATFPFQIIFNLIGVFIADSYGPGYCFIICLVFTIPSSIIRVITFSSLVETSQKYALFYVCQILNACGLASVTILPTKLTSIWFLDRERVLANSIGSNAQLFGFMSSYIKILEIAKCSEFFAVLTIFNLTFYEKKIITIPTILSPHVVSASIIPEDIINTENVDEKFFFLALYGVILATIGIFLTLGFLYYSNKQGLPEINNCPTLTSQEIITEIKAKKSSFCTELGNYLKPLGPALKSYTGFLSLFCFISFGYAIGQVYLMNIPQIICTFGYSKIMQSYISICTILASGVATSLVASWISWKWRAEVATTKVLCGFALVGIWSLAFVGTTDGMDGLQGGFSKMSDLGAKNAKFRIEKVIKSFLGHFRSFLGHFKSFQVILRSKRVISGLFDHY